jgi:hypothetical protein
MVPEVTASFRFTVTELLTGMRAHYRTGIAWWTRIFFMVAGTLMVTAGIVTGLKFGMSRVGFMLFFGTFLLLQFTVIQPVVLRMQFRRRPDRDAEFVWRFAPGQIISDGAGFKTELKWDALAKVVQVPDGFLFYPNSRVFQWVPKHAFRNDAEFQQVADWAREKTRVFKGRV